MLAKATTAAHTFNSIKMGSEAIDIKISGNKFKLLIGLIIAIGSIQTYILANRQVTRSDMIHVLDSLHHRQLLFTHTERNHLEHKIEKSRIEQDQKIEQIIVKPLDGILKRITVMETRLYDRIGVGQQVNATNGVEMKWQLYQLNNKLDSIPEPKTYIIKADEEIIDNRNKPVRVRN